MFIQRLRGFLFKDMHIGLMCISKSHEGQKVSEGLLGCVLNWQFPRLHAMTLTAGHSDGKLINFCLTGKVAIIYSFICFFSFSKGAFSLMLSK